MLNQLPEPTVVQLSTLGKFQNCPSLRRHGDVIFLSFAQQDVAVDQILRCDCAGQLPFAIVVHIMPPASLNKTALVICGAELTPLPHFSNLGADESALFRLDHFVLFGIGFSHSGRRFCSK